MRRETRGKSPRLRSEILAKQNNACFYCNQQIGSLVQYGKKVILLKAALEHVIPYCYCQNNIESNLVVACHVCNSMKSDKIFDTMADLLEYIQGKWLKSEGGLCKLPVNNAKYCSHLKKVGKSSVRRNAAMRSTMPLRLAAPTVENLSRIKKCEQCGISYRIRFSTQKYCSTKCQTIHRLNIRNTTKVENNLASKCNYCGKYDDPINMYVHKKLSYHRECKKEHHALLQSANNINNTTKPKLFIPIIPTRKEFAGRICELCGMSYHPTRYNQKFCTRECGNKALASWRKQKKDGPLDAGFRAK